MVIEQPILAGEGGAPVANAPVRIALLSDFGAGPYVGQIQLLLSALAPRVPVVSLMSDLPEFRPDLAAYLLPGLARAMPAQTLYVCVVDPGVGTERGVLAVQDGLDWWLAPDNGLLVPLLTRRPGAKVFRVRWRPRQSSASFHGRDLFAPVAAALVAGRLALSEPAGLNDLMHSTWPADAWRVCYIDAFGNLISGVRADQLSTQAQIELGGQGLAWARTFGEVGVGAAFWYENAFGLVEIAVNQGRADRQLGAGLDAAVCALSSDGSV